MTRRLALIIHLTSEERALVFDYFKYFKSQQKTAKFCMFLLSRKGDHYSITRPAVKAWLLSVHPEVYAQIREQLKVEQATRKAKGSLRPKEKYTMEDIVKAIRE